MGWRSKTIVGFLALVILGAVLAVIWVGPGLAQPVIPPVSLVYKCDETPTTDDFNRFLSDFRAAVSVDDSAKLFALTSKCEFVWWDWWHQGVRLRTAEDIAGQWAGHPTSAGHENVNPALVFEIQADFVNNYPIIFSTDIKRHLLTGQVTQHSNGSFSIDWRDRGRVSLVFRPLANVGYKFMGNDWEP